MPALYYNNWDNSYIPNILKEIYLDKVYQPYMSHIQDGIVFDLGLNIGLFTQFASKYAKHVYSFEPARESYELAHKNLEDCTNITLTNKAIAEKDGTMKFYRNTNSTMNSLNAFVDDKSQQVDEVETIRLDTFIKEHKIKKINFAKIDVEGTEDKLFLSESFQNIVPILDSFVYEYHSWCQSPAHLINQALEDYGYEVKQIPSEATIFGAVKI